MQHIFEELDHQLTPFGEISLRRRTEPRLDNILIYEVKLGDEFLMSSLFVEAEEQLSTLALAQVRQNGHEQNLQVVVGGLGLGYTAVTALNDDAVTSLRTFDVMQPVISWHQRGILPVGDQLQANPKSELIHADFFAVATDEHQGFLNDHPVHAVLMDIDHSPSHWLNDQNQGFYTVPTLRKVAAKIHAGGVFALWSNERPDKEFIGVLESVFASAEAHIVRFDNPYSGGESINTVYTAVVR